MVGMEDDLGAIEDDLGTENMFIYLNKLLLYTYCTGLLPNT